MVIVNKFTPILIEIKTKFNLKQRGSIKWFLNEQTNYCFCNNCGACMSGVKYAQLSGADGNVRICQFCLEKMVGDIKSSAKGTDSKLREKWNTDVFMQHL
jgi:hypothetical protein